jgi:glycosyltransferase involved in cell wall biosynthesis
LGTASAALIIEMSIAPLSQHLGARSTKKIVTRLAIVSSHPIQYNAPVFRSLATTCDIDLHVFFSWRGTAEQQDVEFGRTIRWDIPLTEGYAHSFVANASGRPGSHHFMGLRNPMMCREIAAFRPDAILVYGWSSFTHLSVLRYFHGKVPLLFRGDSTLLSRDRLWKAPFRRSWLTWVFSHVDRALYVGQRNREYFDAHGVPEVRLSWAPHSIDYERFASGASDLQGKANAERASYGIPSNATVFTFAGKFVPRKEPALLLEAFRKMTRKVGSHAVHLVMVGTGPLEWELRKIAADLHTVHFVGFKNQSEMPAAYRLGDVFVLPSSRETWGLSVNEAMACGRPVIVSDRVGCAVDLAADPRFSSVFASGSQAELLNVLTAWSKPREDLLKAGQLAQQCISAWSTEAAAKAIAGAVMLEVRRA